MVKKTIYKIVISSAKYAPKLMYKVFDTRDASLLWDAASRLLKQRPSSSLLLLGPFS